MATCTSKKTKKKTATKALTVKDVIEVRKDYLVHVTLKNNGKYEYDEVYDVTFRRDPETDTIQQVNVFQKQWDPQIWSFIPKLVPDSRMYLNTRTNKLELIYDTFSYKVPDECVLMTYEMFDTIKFT